MHKLTTILLAFIVVGFSSCRKSMQESFDSKMKTIGTAELGTVEYTVTKVVKVDQNGDLEHLFDGKFNMNKLKIGDRKMLFSTKATIKAGIKLTPENYYVSIDEDAESVSLTLPKAEILSFDMKSEDSKLEYEQVSATRFDFNNIERQGFLKEAEAQIRADKSINILADAEVNAEQFFRTMLSQMGFEKIEINFAN